MDKFAKRLQSRLSAKNYRFNKEECRQAIAMASANPELPTEAEMILAFNRLIGSSVEETQAITPIQAEEIIQAHEPAPEIEEPKTEPAALTVADNSSEIAQAPAVNSQLSQAEITQAVDQSIARLGINASDETVGILTQFANQLTGEIRDLEEMIQQVTSLYLIKRQNVLTSGIQTIDSLRSAQSSSFKAGLDPNFFERTNRNKQQFMSQIQAAFN